jgi:hypothetical protein
VDRINIPVTIDITTTKIQLRLSSDGVQGVRVMNVPVDLWPMVAQAQNLSIGLMDIQPDIVNALLKSA